MIMPNSIGSGLDINAIVDNRITKENVQLKRLEQKKSINQLQSASYTQLRSSIKKLADAVSKFDTMLQQNFYKVSSSNESVASASINSNTPTPCNFTLNVTQLAMAHQIGSAQFSAEDEPLNLSGDMILSQGSNSYTINIKNTDSLDDIRNNINNTLGHQGITANIMQTTDGSGQNQYMLLLSATNTGTINQISMGGDNPLQISNVLQIAQDAQFTIDNYSVTRSSNTVSDVLEGVTFQLHQSPGTTTIAVNTDTTNQVDLITDSLTTFINAYNQIMDELAKNRANRSLNDSTYPLVIKNLQEMMSQSLGSNTINSLYQLGIKLSEAEIKTNDEGQVYTVTGKLTIDQKLLKQNIQQNLPDVRAFFAQGGTNFDNQVLNSLTTIQTKTIYNKEQIINQENYFLNKRISKEQDRLDELRSTLTDKYAALDTIISKYQQIGDFMEQQIAMLNKPKK